MDGCKTQADSGTYGNLQITWIRFISKQQEVTGNGKAIRPGLARLCVCPPLRAMNVPKNKWPKRYQPNPTLRFQPGYMSRWHFKKESLHCFFGFSALHPWSPTRTKRLLHASSVQKASAHISYRKTFLLLQAWCHLKPPSFPGLEDLTRNFSWRVPALFPPPLRSQNCSWKLTSGNNPSTDIHYWELL